MHNGPMYLKGRAMAVVGAMLVVWLAAVAWDRAQSASAGAAPAGKATQATQAAPSPGAGQVVATVDGTPITRDEVDKDLIVKLNELEGEIYEVRQQQLDTIIADRLLTAEAKRRGLTVD